MLWYVPVLRGLGNHVFLGTRDTWSVENMLFQLQGKQGVGEDGDIFGALSMYLKRLWNMGAYDLVIDFLVHIRWDSGFAYERLDAFFDQDKEWNMLMKIVDLEAMKAEEMGFYDKSFKAVVQRIYTQPIVGVDLDIGHIDQAVIHAIASGTKQNNYHIVFKPLFQYFIQEEALEWVWYLFNEYIVSSLAEFKDYHIYNYLNLYVFEMMGIFSNFAYIERVHLKIDDRTSYVLPTTDFDCMFNCWKIKDKQGLKEYRDRMLFKHHMSQEAMLIDEKLLDSLLYLYHYTIYTSEFLKDDVKEHFTYLISVLLLYFDKGEETARFIRGNYKYYPLNTLNSLGIVAIESDDFQTVNMLYGMFLTEKIFLDNLHEGLEVHLKNVLAINEINQILSQKTTALYMENMSEIVEEILKEKPNKYQKLFEKEWDKEQAEKTLIRNYKAHKENSQIETYHKQAFRRDSDRNKNPYIRNAYKYFVTSYNEADESYQDIYKHEDLKALLLSAEWLWEREAESTIDRNIKSGHEYTYLVANYLKTIELYLAKKLEEIYGDNPSLNKEKINIQKSSLGTLYHQVGKTPAVLDQELSQHISNYLKAINCSED